MLAVWGHYLLNYRNKNVYPAKTKRSLTSFLLRSPSPFSPFHFLSLTDPPLSLSTPLYPQSINTPTWFISSQAAVAMATIQEGG